MIFILSACTAVEKEVVVDDYFDPRVTGGTTNATPKTHDVLNLQIVTMNDYQVTLSWYNPAIYEGLDYEIYVYRTVGDGTSDTLELPDPSDAGSGAFLYYPRLDFSAAKITSYLDDNSDNNVALHSGDVYTYHVYVEKDGYFSEGQKLTVTIPTEGESISIPNSSEFWRSYVAKFGESPNLVGDVTQNTLKITNLDASQSGGQIAYGKGGLVAAKVDTDNNRVVIYTNKQGLNCYDSFTEGTLEFNSCVIINANAPMQAFAVLGQENFFTKYDCADPLNTLDSDECLTAPKGVIFHEDRLFITDGNDRIVIFDDYPEYGCYNIQNFIGDVTPRNCTFDRVIGKRNTEDLVNYSLAIDGDSAFSCPSGMAFLEDNLYVADTCNNRIIRIANATNPTLVNCTNATWKTSQCLFSSVLGQSDFFTNHSFAAEYDSLGLSYDYIADTLVGDLSFVKRYFANPTRLYFTDNRLVVVSNEDFSRVGPWGNLELYSRILFFDQNLLEGTFPSCTGLTFFASGCDALNNIGQKDWHQLSVVSIASSYEDNNYALRQTSGIEIYATYLFLTDYITNEVIVYENYDDFSSGTTKLPSMRVPNPLGEWVAEQGRALPNLMGLTDIKYLEKEGNLLIFDGQGSRYYKVPITEF